jgi:uncharacterized protein (DUF1330 family)
MAKAYSFGEIEVTDPVTDAEYESCVRTIAAYGGKAVVGS